MGFFLHKGVRIKQNWSVFVGTFASLCGGIFSAMTHGLPYVGVDFFNLFVAFLFSIISLYVFAPNTRKSIANAGSELYIQMGELKKLFSAEEKIKSHYFNERFWKNITSNLSP